MARWVAVWAVLAVVVPAGARAGFAPGHVVWPVGTAVSARMRGLGELTGARLGVCADAFPDGGVLATVQAADEPVWMLRLGPTGAPESRFGHGGRLALSQPAFAGAQARDVLARPDGSAYVALAQGPFATVAVAHVLADGQLDPTYGEAGVARTSATAGPSPVQAACPAVGTELTALPDGRLLVVSSDGRLVRLLTDGREDASFTEPTTHGVGAVLPDGRLVIVQSTDCPTAGTRAARPRPVPYEPPTTCIVVLRPDGSVDPGFNGGTPLMAVPHVSEVVARPDGTVDAFGPDVAARLDGSGNVLLRSQLGEAAHGIAYLVFPQSDGGEALVSSSFGPTVLFKLDASLGLVGPVSLYAPPPMGGADVFGDPSPISHTTFAATGSFAGNLLLPRSEGFLAVGAISLIDRRTRRRRDEVGVVALNSDSSVITSYGGSARPAHVAARVVRHHPLLVDVTVPRAGAILVQAWDRSNRQRAQVRWAALTAGTVRVRLKRLPEARPMGPIARYTVSFRDLTGVNARVTLGRSARRRRRP